MTQKLNKFIDKNILIITEILKLSAREYKQVFIVDQGL